MEPESTATLASDFLQDNPTQETDLPPEFCHYQDEGCELSASCLNCPYERCVYDEPGGRQHRIKDIRDREISRLYHTGKPVPELAAMFGVSERTVHRALKKVME